MKLQFGWAPSVRPSRQSPVPDFPRASFHFGSGEYKQTPENIPDKDDYDIITPQSDREVFSQRTGGPPQPGPHLPHGPTLPMRPSLFGGSINDKDATFSGTSSKATTNDGHPLPSIVQHQPWHQSSSADAKPNDVHGPSHITITDDKDSPVTGRDQHVINEGQPGDRDKQEHLELVSVLEKSMQGRGSSKAVDQAEVNLLVNRLFSLKHFGKNLKDLQTDIAYTHARTNRENPHRVKARNAVRRGGHGFGYRQASNNSIRMPFSVGSQGRTQSVLVKRQSVMRPGFSTGTMRTSQQQQTESAWSMPGSSNGPATQMAVRTSPSPLEQPPTLKKTWGLSSFNPFR